MADGPISGLTATTTPALTDLIYLLVDPSGTPLDRKAALSALLTLFVGLTTDQTVAGVKTFSASPIVPTPTTDMQAATKKYGDDTFYLKSGQYAVNTVATSGATETIPATHSAHKVTMDQNCEFTFSSPTQDGHTFLLWILGAFTPTLTASVDWDGGTPPTYADDSLYAFSTLDGGTTWLGSLVASGLA